MVVAGSSRFSLLFIIDEKLKFYIFMLPKISHILKQRAILFYLPSPYKTLPCLPKKIQMVYKTSAKLDFL